MYRISNTLLGACAAASVLSSLAFLPAAAQSDRLAGAADTKEGVKQSLSDRVLSGKRTARQLTAQIMLDRAGFSPGVIDGLGGGNTTDAVRAYQRANDMEETGQVDGAFTKHLREKDTARFLKVITLKSADLDRPFRKIPEPMAEQAEMDSLGYENIQELIAERYHMDVDLLTAMNPDAEWTVGSALIVAAAGPAKLDEPVDRIIVDRSENSVRAYSGDRQVAFYPATVGSSDMPSPSGTMTVVTVAPDANYTFDPETNNWGGQEALSLAAGPNNPVGGVWIDLSKETYGIHGSPDPALIGKTASHGCVRLTNWDARELADAVEAGASVEFVG